MLLARYGSKPVLTDSFEPALLDSESAGDKEARYPP